MANYGPSTIARIGDLVNGIRVDTSVLSAATYLLTGNNQTEIFNIYGRIKLHNLFGEVTTVLDNQATTLYYNATWTTPTIAVGAISGASGSLAQLAVGEKISWLGGAVATAVVLTATPGIADINVTPHILGGVTTAGANYVGTIGILTAAASMTSGAVRFTCFYTPMSDGAYVTAAL